MNVSKSLWNRDISFYSTNKLINDQFDHKALNYTNFQGGIKIESLVIRFWGYFFIVVLFVSSCNAIKFCEILLRSHPGKTMNQLIDTYEIDSIHEVK